MGLKPRKPPLRSTSTRNAVLAAAALSTFSPANAVRAGYREPTPEERGELYNPPAEYPKGPYAQLRLGSRPSPDSLRADGTKLKQNPVSRRTRATRIGALGLLFAAVGTARELLRRAVRRN